MRASASLLRMPQYRRPPATQFRTRSLVQRGHYISCDAGTALICKERWSRYAWSSPMQRLCCFARLERATNLWRLLLRRLQCAIDGMVAALL